MPCRCTSAGRSTPRDAYSSFVARALRDAARADVEAMFRRFGADDRTDEGDPVIARARADVEAIIARQGFIVAGQPERSEEQTSELQSLMRSSCCVFCLSKKIHK